uniref:TRP domain-containing protein n=1 Tax=Ascaris lumbricoides TaxID=6252 RepID=A0A0M3I334_ASCLU
MHWLTICILVLVASGVVLVGITHIEPDAVRQVMNNLHSLFMLKLESFSSCDTRSQHMSSLLMSFAIANTLGDDRVDDKDFAFKVAYVLLGSTAFLLIVSLLTRESERRLDAIFASNKRNDENICSKSLERTSDLSEEHFLAHVQRKRAARLHAGNQVFGGNKLELYEEESRSIRHALRPAFAVLLILLLCILLGAVFLHLIVYPTNCLITDIFANFFYITTTSSPKWIYLNNPSIWQLLFLYANLFVGSVLAYLAGLRPLDSYPTGIWAQFVALHPGVGKCFQTSSASCPPVAFVHKPEWGLSDLH